MKINQLKAGVILSYVSIFLSNAIAIVYTPIMLRLLGQSEYGLYQLVASVVSYLGLLSFGFGSAYIRYFSKYKIKKEKKKIAKLNGMFLIVYTIIGGIALFAGSILVVNIEKIFGTSLTFNELSKAKILMIIMVINISVAFPLSVFNSYITANEKYFFQRILSLIKTIINPFVMLPILLLGYQSIGMVTATVIINIIIEVSNVVYCFKHLHIEINFRNFDLSLFKEIVIFSSFIFINIVVDQINWNLDKFLLGMFKGTVAVAVYGLASTLNTYYISFSTSVVSVFIPRVNQIVAIEKDDTIINELFLKVGRIQFIIMSLILTGLIFFGKSFIILWAGEEYINSYYIVLILVIPVTIPLIQNLGIEVQRAKNKHKFRSWLYLVIAIANACISIPLCSLYGGIGCALGTGFSLLVGNGLIMNIYYHKKIGLNMIRFWKEILGFYPAFIIPIILGFTLNYFTDLYGIITFGCVVILYTLVFGINMWLIGMNNYEKNLIKGLLSSFKLKVKSHR